LFKMLASLARIRSQLRGMMLCEFRQLSPSSQLLAVLVEGTYLTQRWEEERGILNLYYLPNQGPGFFAEVSIDGVQDCFVVVHSFSSSAELEAYAAHLPDLS
jgi:hypothetical protein